MSATFSGFAWKRGRLCTRPPHANRSWNRTYGPWQNQTHRYPPNRGRYRDGNRSARTAHHAPEYRSVPGSPLYPGRLAAPATQGRYPATHSGRERLHLPGQPNPQWWSGPVPGDGAGIQPGPPAVAVPVPATRRMGRSAGFYDETDGRPG